MTAPNVYKGRRASILSAAQMRRATVYKHFIRLRCLFNSGKQHCLFERVYGDIYSIATYRDIYLVADCTAAGE
jgi:hypothetical protein